MSGFPLERRSPHRWTEEEDRIIRDNLGALSIEQLSARLQIPGEVVLRRANRLGVYFFDESRYTARKAARILGMDTKSVIRRLEEGHIEGERIGSRFWRAELRTINLEEAKNPSVKKDGHCINCDNILLQGEQNYCSKRCNSEYVPGMTFPPHFRFKFQRFLNEAGLIKWKSFYLINGRLDMNRYEELTEVQDKIEIALIDEFPGRIVPREYLSYAISSNDRKFELDEVTNEARALKGKLRNPNDIFDYEGVGWSVGVEPVKVSLQELRFLRQLWQMEGYWVSRGYISRNLMGDTKKSSLNTIDDIASGFQSDFESSPFTVEFQRKEVNNKYHYFYKLGRTKTC